MKWWQYAVIISVIWMILFRGAFLIHTGVIQKGKLTPVQYSAIDKGYNRLAIIGLIPIWAILMLASRKRSER